MSDTPFIDSLVANTISGDFIERAKMAGLNDFLSLPDLEYREVTIQGRTFLVRGLTAGERDKYEAGMLEGKGKDQKVNLENARAKLIVLGLVNPETKQRMFAERDWAQVARKSARIVEPLFDAIRDLSGMSDADIEELTGNSNDPSENSSST